MRRPAAREPEGASGAPRSRAAQLPEESGSVQVRQTHNSAIIQCACFNKTVLNSSCGLSGGPFLPCEPERETGLLERGRVQPSGEKVPLIGTSKSSPSLDPQNKVKERSLLFFFRRGNEVPQHWSVSCARTQRGVRNSLCPVGSPYQAEDEASATVTQTGFKQRLNKCALCPGQPRAQAGAKVPSVWSSTKPFLRICCVPRTCQS